MNIRSWAVVGASAVAVLAGTVQPASAGPVPPSCPFNYECGYYWYSDASHTTLVGSKTIDCDGNVVSGGVTSRYLVSSVSPC